MVEGKGRQLEGEGWTEKNKKKNDIDKIKVQKKKVKFREKSLVEKDLF